MISKNIHNKIEKFWKMRFPYENINFFPANKEGTITFNMEQLLIIILSSFVCERNK